jgi:hypothetical protein
MNVGVLSKISTSSFFWRDNVIARASFDVQCDPSSDSGPLHPLNNLSTLVFNEGARGSHRTPSLIANIVHIITLGIVYQVTIAFTIEP